MLSHEDTRGPDLKFPPPLLPLSLIGIAYLADIYLPLPINEGAGQWLTGLVLVIASVCLATILENAVGSRKSAQAIDSSNYMKKCLSPIR
jgi:hypothetical protein